MKSTNYIQIIIIIFELTSFLTKSAAPFENKTSVDLKRLIEEAHTNFYKKTQDSPNFFADLYTYVHKEENKEIVENAQRIISSLPIKDHIIQEKAVLGALRGLALAGDKLSWCDCSNAPAIMRIALASRIALDTLYQFNNLQELTINSFATGGLYKGKAQVLQEIVLVASITAIWPQDKTLIINIMLIGPEVSNIDIKALQNIYKRWISLPKPNVALGISYCSNHTSYIEKIQRQEFHKTHILFTIDTKILEMASGITQTAQPAINSLLTFTKLNDIYGDILFSFVNKNNIRKVDSPPLTEPFEAYIYLNKNQRPFWQRIENALTDPLKQLLTSINNRTDWTTILKHALEKKSHLSKLTEYIDKEYIQKSPNWSTNSLVNMELAFKKLIINTLYEHSKLIYNLNYNIYDRTLLPEDFIKFMDNQIFYKTPTFGSPDHLSTDWDLWFSTEGN